MTKRKLLPLLLLALGACSSKHDEATTAPAAKPVEVARPVPFTMGGTITVTPQGVGPIVTTRTLTKDELQAMFPGCTLEALQHDTYVKCGADTELEVLSSAGVIKMVSVKSPNAVSSAGVKMGMSYNELVKLAGKPAGVCMKVMVSSDNAGFSCVYPDAQTAYDLDAGKIDLGALPAAPTDAMKVSAIQWRPRG